MSSTVMSPTPPRIDYSIIIPAFNEEEFLPQTLQCLAFAIDSLTREHELVGEVIVVNNNSTDNTAEIAKTFTGLESCMQVVDEPDNQISKARNCGARVAGSARLIFLDADTDVTPSLIHCAVTALDIDAVGGGTVIAIDKAHKGGEFVTALWNRIARMSGYAAGCFVFCRKDAFDAVGGFSEKVYASEEIWLARALKKWGKPRNLKFVVLDEEIVTSARKLEWLSTFAIIKQTLVIFLFPFALKYKRFCQAWYRRPE